jgi:hypothetical protein
LQPFFIDFDARQTERLACFAMGEPKMISPEHPKTEKVDDAHFANLRQAGKLLFELGQVYATPAVLAHLERHEMYPSVLLGPHCHGDYGELDEEDRRANNAALVSGGRILSVYVVEGQRIYVITDAADEQGVRLTTTILFPREYLPCPSPQSPKQSRATALNQSGPCATSCNACQCCH